MQHDINFTTWSTNLVKKTTKFTTSDREHVYKKTHETHFIRLHHVRNSPTRNRNTSHQNMMEESNNLGSYIGRDLSD